MQTSVEQTSEPAASSEYPVKIDWVQKMQFVAKDDRNHAIVLDTNPENDGEDTGPTPGRLLLMAVAGCTSMDVVDILIKSRQKLTGLSVSARGVQNKDYPKYYTEMHLFYTVRGVHLEKSRVERAIQLSQEKYCSVGATVSGKAKIFVEYRIEEEK